MTQIIFYLGILIVLATLIPLIRHDFWVFRIFEYPRLQKLSFNLLLVFLSVLFLPRTGSEKLMLIALTVNMVYLVYLIFPFTIFGKKQIINSNRAPDDFNISILIANVYQYNRNSNAYLKLIKSCIPDVVLMVETDQWWATQINIIGVNYPYQLKIPLPNTYGMIFYSKLEIRNGTINFLVEADIPSIEVEVKLPSGDWVKLYCLHPQPPVPQENPRSTERDKEILMVAAAAKDCKLPVVVIGDLNDVAWSYTTELFGKVSGLLDPRRGRGFFNSFHAKYFFLRFPLDHIFCSTDFTLYEIKRMNSCGSDHFPMCINLQYNPTAEVFNDQLIAEAQDFALAEKKIKVTTN